MKNYKSKRIIIASIIGMIVFLIIPSCASTSGNDHSEVQNNALMEVLGGNNSIITVSVEDFCKFEYTGLSGYASTWLSIDAEQFSYIIDDLNISNAEKASAKRIISEMTYNLSKEESIKNGDNITAELSYDAAGLENLGIRLSADSITGKVSGLSSPTVIDPFEGIRIRYKGYSGNATISFDFTDQNDIAKNYIEIKYNSDRDNGSFRKSDKITLIAEYEEDYPLIMGYVFEPRKKEISLDFIMEDNAELTDFEIQSYSHLTELIAQPMLQKFIDNTGDTGCRLMKNTEYFFNNRENYNELTNRYWTIYEVHSSNYELLGYIFSVACDVTMDSNGDIWYDADSSTYLSKSKEIGYGDDKYAVYRSLRATILDQPRMFDGWWLSENEIQSSEYSEKYVLHSFDGTIYGGSANLPSASTPMINYMGKTLDELESEFRIINNVLDNYGVKRVAFATFNTEFDISPTANGEIVTGMYVEEKNQTILPGISIGMSYDEVMEYAKNNHSSSLDNDYYKYYDGGGIEFTYDHYWLGFMFDDYGIANACKISDMIYSEI